MRKILYSFKNVLFIILGVFFVYLQFLFFRPMLKNIINLGNLSGLILSFLFALICFAHKYVFNFIKEKYNNKMCKIIINILIVLLIIGLGVLSFINYNMVKAMNDSPKNGENMIVLGCKLHGERPSEMLVDRLNVAKNYLNKNKKAICVVSGGQGADESVPEAVAMKKWLMENGIDESRILVEDKSENTYQNIKLSMELLNDVESTEKVAIATDGFHQFRAQIIAETWGITTKAVNAKTNPEYVPTFWVREWFGIVKDHLFNIIN